MFDFEEALKLVAKQTVLCVGDLMLDDFVYGEVTRISPEAPTPVLAVARSEVEIGGAGNVARNIAALGAHCIFVGLIGKDDAALTLDRCIRQAQRLGRSPSRHRGRAAHHAQGALRVRASFGASDAGGLGDGAAGQRHKRERRHRARRSGAAAVRRGGAVRLRQGRADAARHPRDHRPGAAARQTGRGRSEGPRLQHLSRRDADHAQPCGTRRGRAPAGDERGRNRQGGGRARAHRRQRSRAGHAQRGGHDASRRRVMRRSTFPPIRSRCATSPAPAIRSRR